jgi:hypothetical protein
MSFALLFGKDKTTRRAPQLASRESPAKSKSLRQIWPTEPPNVRRCYWRPAQRLLVVEVDDEGILAKLVSEGNVDAILVLLRRMNR